MCCVQDLRQARRRRVPGYTGYPLHPAPVESCLATVHRLSERRTLLKISRQGETAFASYMRDTHMLKGLRALSLKVAIPSLPL